MFFVCKFYSHDLDILAIFEIVIAFVCCIIEKANLPNQSNLEMAKAWFRTNFNWDFDFVNTFESRIFFW